MSNYSSTPEMCRVDFFKPGGKWYTTEAFKWIGWGKEHLIYDAFYNSLIAAFPDNYSGMTAVCLEPYHEYAYPLMLVDWKNYKP